MTFDVDPERFWARVNKSAECWIWQGAPSKYGYGVIRIKGKNAYAHRVAHVLSKGPIPEGLVIDHLCRNKICVRPTHLEAVTPAENTRRGAVPYGVVRTTCRTGHDISNPENIYTVSPGKRSCVECARIAGERRRAERATRIDGRTILKTHCPHGHAYDEANTRIDKTGFRRCRTCARNHDLKHRSKRQNQTEEL